MLTPVPMAKVAIVGPKTKMADAVEAAHRLNLLHIEDYGSQDEFFDIGSPLPQGAKVAERLLRVRGVMKGAHMTPPPGARPFTLANLRGLEEKLQEVEDELAKLVGERDSLREERKGIQEQQTTLARIANFPLPTRLLAGYKSLATAAGFVGADTNLAPLRAVHADLEIVESREEDGRFIAVFAPRDAERSLQEALAKLGYEPVELPALDAPPAQGIQSLEARAAELDSKVAALEEKIATIRERHAAAFFAFDEHLSIEAEKSTSPVRFRVTPNSFLIEGWIPHDAFAKLESTLARATQNGVYVTRTQRAARSRDAPHSDEHSEHHGEEKHVDDVPVLLKNPKRAGAYELLTDTYSRPKYSELDPTLFMFIGFPIFYGAMLGDVGYGLILLGMVLFGGFNALYKLVGFQSKWHLNRIFLHASISSILFGILYGEFFGLELFGPHGIVSHYETHIGPIPYPLARLEYVKLLLALFLLVGFVHLFVGLVLGFRNAAAQHGMGDAVKHRGSWLFILVAVGLAGVAVVPDTLQLGAAPEHEAAEGGHEAAAAEPYHPVVANPKPLLYAALAFFLVGLVLLVMGEGGIAVLELPTVISNLLSYSRLLAIGLSGVGIALAGNKIGAMMMDGGIGGMIAGIVVLVIFHALGVVLGIIGPALHALRLHFVEFFTKFYEGGGTPYQPFGAQRKYTIQEVKQA